MNKEELRKEYKIIRDKIEDRDNKSKTILKNILSTKEYQRSKTIALYSSISSEVKTEELIRVSLKEKRVVLPRINEDNTMNFYEIKSLEDLKTGKFNIKEPIKESKVVKKEDIDLIIIPGICFDLNKNRIGYGKGYYDRYLSNTKIKKIGICYEKQIVKEIEANKTDIKLDYLITETNIY